MKINFYVQEQTLSVDENYRIVEGSKNYLKARFYFTGEWCNLTKTAVFSTPDKQKVYHVLLQNNECFVPPEVITKAGFSVSVFAGDTINTNPVTITVGESGFIPNVSPPEPTPSIYSQMINQFDEKLGSANKVLTKITSSNAVTQQQVTDHRTASELDHPDNSVTDAKIGVRTIADPNSSGTISGSLTTLLTTTAQAQRSEAAARKAADAALENNKLDKTQYASVSQPGVIMLYNKNGINRSGLVVYDDGSAVVNTKTERGVTRDGAGQIGINPATEAEITAGTDAYKPIVPATLSHAVQSVTGELSGLETASKASFTEAINEVRRESINADFIKDVYGYAPPIFVDVSANVRVGVVSVTTPMSGLFNFNGFIARNDLKNIIKISGEPVGVSTSLREQIEYTVNGLELEDCQMYVVINLDTLEIEEANVVLNDEELNTTDELLTDGRLKLWLAEVIPPYSDGMVTNGYCDVSVYGKSRQLDGIDEAIGTLDNLNTTDRSSIVAAINELNNKITELTASSGNSAQS